MRTSINYTNNRDLGNTTELQAALIWARSMLDVTDLVSCIGSGAAFFLFPERVMKLPSDCFPKQIRLITKSVTTSTACAPSSSTGDIFYGYREGFNNNLASFSSVFYIGGPNPPNVPFKVPGSGDIRLVCDWTGIAFTNIVYCDGVIYYFEPGTSPSDMVGFKVTVYSNKQFCARAMTPNELAVLGNARPDYLFTDPDEPNGTVYTYLKSPFQDMGGTGEFWWSPARFRIMQQIVQAAYMRDEHKLMALRHVRALNSRDGQQVRLSMRHYPTMLAKTTLLTGYNPELAIMAQLELIVNNAVEQYPQLANRAVHLLTSARYVCNNNMPFIVLEIASTAHSIIVAMHDLTAQVVPSDDVPYTRKTIMNP